MALIFMEGFDHYGTGDQNAALNAGGWVTTQSANTIQAGRAGGYAFRCWNTTYYHDLGVNATTLVIGIAYYHVAAPGSETNWIYISDGSTHQVTCSMNNIGQFSLWRGNQSARLAGPYTSLVLNQNSWYYIEFKITFSDSGAYEMRVDGTTILSGSGDTTFGANQYANRIYLSGWGGSNYDFRDDIYVLDGTAGLNDFLGDVKVVTSVPTAEGTQQDFTPSTGVTHYTLVDETGPPDVNDYVSSSTANQIELYNFPDITPGSTIKGVRVCEYVEKDDAGARTVQIVYRDGAGGTNRPTGVTETLQIGYKYINAIYENDPATSAAWTESGYNAAQFGLKVIS